MKLVLKIGGSILFDGYELKQEKIMDLVKIIKSLRNQGHELGLVVGGGKPARIYANMASKLGASNDFQDLIAIVSTRQNARLFIAALDEACPHPPQDHNQLLTAIRAYPLVICGGFQPGQSTNAVAAIFAEAMGADLLVNISNVEKVYDKDPSKYSDAVSYDELDYGTFSSIISQNEQTPGGYALFDRVGLELIRRSKIRLQFISGDHLEHLSDVIKGEKRGTIIQ